MTYRHTRKEYGGYHSWRVWRNANATTLADSGVPSVALESEWNWGFFLQEADPTLMGGPPFDLHSLTHSQLVALRDVLEMIPAEARGGDLLALLERALAAPRKPR